MHLKKGNTIIIVTVYFKLAKKSMFINKNNKQMTKYSLKQVNKSFRLSNSLSARLNNVFQLLMYERWNNDNVYENTKYIN